MTVADRVVVYAHGIGGRSDLPVPSWLAVYAGGIVVAVSFFVLVSLWTASKFGRDRSGLGLPGLDRVLSSRPVELSLRLVGLGAWAALLYCAFAGPDDDGLLNPAPTWFYVWFWVGLVPFSILCGAAWVRINPLRTLALTLRSLLHIRTEPLPAVTAYWPAVISLFAFVWLELVYDGSASPRVVGEFVAVYSPAHIAAGTWFGEPWFRQGDGFAVYARMIAAASPWGRRTDGTLVLRNPFNNLAAFPDEPNLTPVVVTVLGSTAFDGLSRSNWWASIVAGTGQAEYLWLGTLGLLAAIAVVAGTFGAAVWLSGRLGGEGSLSSGRLAHTLVPIAIGYTVAHYFSFAVFQGQEGLILSSDPLARGWNLLGLRGHLVDYLLISTITIAVVQVGAIVIGHVIAVVSAHDAVLATTRSRRARSSQYPMLVVMILYTTVGILLVSRG